MVNRASRKNNAPRRRKASGRTGSEPRVIAQPGRIGSQGPSVFTRTYLKPKAVLLKLTKESELYPTQGTQGYVDLAFSISDFLSADVMKQWDQFRFDSISIEAKYNPIDAVTPQGLSNLFQPIDLFVSFDSTGASDPEIEWVNYRNRANLSHVTLTPQAATKSLMSFVPAVIRSSSGGDAANSAVFSPHMFYNMNEGQSTLRFGKCGVYAQCNTFNSVSDTPFQVDLVVKAKIALKMPRNA